MRQAAEASASLASGISRSGSAMADDVREITEAWTRYAQEVMRHTSEASQALPRARNFTEMLEVQAKLLRDNTQSFLDHTGRMAQTVNRMAMRPFNALKETTDNRNRGLS